MAKGKPIEQTKAVDLPVPGVLPAPEAGKVQVNQGNVPIVTVQLLNEINIKLGKLIEIAER